MRKLKVDEAGCRQSNCRRSVKCLRYLVALKRPEHPRNTWIWVEDTEKCEVFWEVENAT